MPRSVPALEWNFNSALRGMALDRAGNLIFLEGNELRKLTPNGQLLPLPLKGEIGPECNYSIFRTDPFYALAIGPDQLPYLFDPYCRVVRRISTDGTNEIVAGRLDPGEPGNNGPARQATLRQVQSMTFDADGNLFLLERDTGLIRKIDPRGIITQAAQFRGGADPVQPNDGWGLAVDSQGNFYVSERFPPHRIVKVTPTGMRSFYATTPHFTFDLAFDRAGNLYARGGQDLPCVRIPPNQKVELVPNTNNHGGGFAVDAAGNIFFTDTPRSLAIASPSGTVRRVAGTGRTAAEAGILTYSLLTPDFIDSIAPGYPMSWIGHSTGLSMINSGRLQPALSGQSSNLAFDSTASLLFMDGRGIAKLDSSRNGALVRVGSEITVRVSSLAVGARDEIYLADYLGHRVLRLSKETGTVTGFAGSGEEGDSGDGGSAFAARFQWPWSLAGDNSGNVFIADVQAHRVRRVDASGVIHAFAGTGAKQRGPEGVPATESPLDTPAGVATDLFGNVYIAESSPTTSRIRMVDRRGIIRTIAGGEANVDGDDGILGTEAKLTRPRFLAVGPEGAVYIVESQRSIRRLLPEETSYPRAPTTGFLNGATFATGPVAPGMVLTIFGTNIGGPSLVRAGVASGRLVGMAGNVSVSFDNVPAPMLYSSTGQIGAIVPYSVTPGRKTRVVVGVGATRSLPVDLDVIEASPGLFTIDSSGKGPAAALNQDGTVNSKANPANSGSVAVLFATGEGQTNPAGVDGLISTTARSTRPVLPVSISMCGRPAEVLYAGSAPGITAGVMQINVRIPAGCTGEAAVVVQVGSRVSPAEVTLFVREP